MESKLKLAESTIWFACVNCGKPQKAYKHEIGEMVECKKCETALFVPGRSNCPPPLPPLPQVVVVSNNAPQEDAEAVPPKVVVVSTNAPKEEAGTVPMSLTVPMTGGAKMETKITQKTADSGFMVFLGGVMVVIGLIAGAMFGVKMPSKA